MDAGGTLDEGGRVWQASVIAADDEDGNRRTYLGSQVGRSMGRKGWVTVFVTVIVVLLLVAGIMMNKRKRMIRKEIYSILLRQCQLIFDQERGIPKERAEALWNLRELARKFREERGEEPDPNSLDGKIEITSENTVRVVMKEVFWWDRPERVARYIQLVRHCSR